MKKVVCNVLHKTSLVVKFREGYDKTTINLGLFPEKKSALISVGILENILHETRGIKGIAYIGCWHIDEVLVPESRMQNELMQRNLVNDVDDFVQKNSYVVEYANKYGQNKLEEIIGYEKERIIQTYVEDDDTLNV